MMPEKYYYITSPIYYVNDKPHIGHFYTTLACDVIARYKKLDGYKVIFATGTDEHGAKIEKRAKELNIDPNNMVDDLSATFKNLFDTMDFKYDDFIRTTEERHIKTVQYIWQELNKKGFIYKGTYEGFYSVSDEAFYTESELNKLADGTLVANSSGSIVEKLQEESYFFKLSDFEKPLLEYYAKHPEVIKPKTRFNEVISFIKSGLKDLSISRMRIKWGIPVPNDKAHVIYVWLDALSNYLTVLGYPTNKTIFENFWNTTTHILGKDILRFHAVYWPAFLLALNLPLPKRIFAHGWWTNEGEKISKSKGNAIDPINIVNTYGLDEFKYFLLREVPFGNDGDFSTEVLVNRINSELANEYGNLCQRSLTIIYKNLQSLVTKPDIIDEASAKLISDCGNLLEATRILIDEQNFYTYLDEVWKQIRNLNRYINEQAPWKLIKNNNFAEANNILYVICEGLKRICIILAPIMPAATTKILDLLGVKLNKRTFETINNLLSEYRITNEPTPLFKKH